jgi:hypothetical protein
MTLTLLQRQYHLADDRPAPLTAVRPFHAAAGTRSHAPRVR